MRFEVREVNTPSPEKLPDYDFFARAVGVGKRRYILLAVCSFFLVSGCESIIQHWPPQLNFTPPPNPYKSSPSLASLPTPQPATDSSLKSSPTSKAWNSRKRRKQASKTKKVAAVSQVPNQTPHADNVPGKSVEGASQATPPVLSLREVGAADKNAATSMINDATRRLARINRDALPKGKAAEYDQVRGFVAAARQALQDQNYELAYGLASKAVSLSKDLTHTAP